MSAATPAYNRLAATNVRLHRLGHLGSIAGWDQASHMPPKGNEARSAALAELGTFREDRLNAQVYAANNARALQMMDRAGWK